jgi:hypothetical protein
MQKVFWCGCLVLVFAAGCSGGVLSEHADTSSPPAALDLGSHGGLKVDTKKQKDGEPDGGKADSSNKSESDPTAGSGPPK